MDLSTPLTQAGRVYKMYAKRLEKLGIASFGDFLFHLPFRYDDFSIISPIHSVRAGSMVTVQGTLVAIKNEFTKRYKKLQIAKVQDATGTLDIIWFNQMFITQVLHPGDTISLSGRVEFYGHKLALMNPAYEVTNETGKGIHTGRLVPIYPETAGVSSKWLRKQVHMLLEQSHIVDYLPEDIRKKYEYFDLPTAIAQIHFPSSIEESQKAKQRLAFDEVFLLQLGAIKRKQEWRTTRKSIPFKTADFQTNIDNFLKSLPFTLTNAQKRAVEEMFADLSKAEPMNRLLEGDVGSGKTVVAAVVMYLAYLNGFQSVLMAPTEILAKQHFLTIEKLLSPLGATIHIATGSKKSKGEMFDILVGTHAVLSEKITFFNLGLVVIDEQQRFGVAQRTIIREKGTNPHLLTMTATPIPRTVALTLYGDLDLSVLDEMPIGRKEVKTWLIPPQKREGAYEWIEKKIQEGDQAFIVCPFIDESESMTTVKAASAEFNRLQKEVFPHLRLELLHGKLKSKEKESVLQDFRDKKIDILIATPVVEVGIDIPNATIIVIEAADRFGLAQLHQLRGRVGRGDKQSYCLLFSESKNESTATRLKAMETMHSGAALAELDLHMRGAGELYGTLQHGRRWLKIASFGDVNLLERAKQEAMKLFPTLYLYKELSKKVAESAPSLASPD